MSLPTEAWGELCPAGCGRHRHPNHLTCATCWFEVPKALRRDVMFHWARRKREPSNEAARQDYQAARNAVLASLSEVEAVAAP